MPYVIKLNKYLLYSNVCRSVTVGGLTMKVHTDKITKGLKIQKVIERISEMRLLILEHTIVQ
jgi:hypothetical protein